MSIQPFSIARLPRIEFGAGVLARLPGLVARHGGRALVVTGGSSLQGSPHWAHLTAGLAGAGVSWEHASVSGEPSPEVVDDLVGRWRDAGIAVVVGIGGGSVLDAAKAVAGLLPGGVSVMEYLEDVGAGRAYAGPALPCIAVPTTAGTGSEATRNAVLSIQGSEGFKKSFRHEDLVPAHALIDPDLMASCPPEQIAANGMDALTQLLESYVSPRANPFTEALVEGVTAGLGEALLAWFEGGEGSAEGRSRMAYAALVSGICLAQTGLGAVHGLASPLGAFFPIPHGVVCGTLVAPVTRANLQVLRTRERENPAREKYARIGNLLSGRQHNNPRNAREALVLTLESWTERLRLPGLGAYGVREADLPRIVARSRGGSMRTNPVVLSDEELTEVLAQRL